MSAVSKATVQAMLNRGRTRMVETYIGEGGLIDPSHNHAYWRGFAQCAKALLDGTAEVMALHDKASNPQRSVHAAFARLPDDFERLTLADMKRHMWAQGVELASDLIAGHNIGAAVKLQDGVRAAIKFDYEHAVAGIDVQDGGERHESPLVSQTAIVSEGGAA